MNLMSLQTSDKFVQKQQDWLTATANALSKRQLDAASLIFPEIEAITDALVHVELSGQSWGSEAEEAFQTAQDIVLLYISEGISKLNAQAILKDCAKQIRENRGVFDIVSEATGANYLVRGTKWLISTTWKDLLASIAALQTIVQNAGNVRDTLIEKLTLPEGASPLGYISNLMGMKADNLIAANTTAPVRTLDKLIVENAGELIVNTNNTALSLATSVLEKTLNVEARVNERLVQSDLPNAPTLTAAEWATKAKAELNLLFGSRDALLILVGFIFLVVAVLLGKEAVFRPFGKQATKGRALRKEVTDAMKSRKGVGTFFFSGKSRGRKTRKVSVGRKVRKTSVGRKVVRKTSKRVRKVRKSKVRKSVGRKSLGRKTKR